MILFINSSSFIEGLKQLGNRAPGSSSTFLEQLQRCRRLCQEPLMLAGWAADINIYTDGCSVGALSSLGHPGLVKMLELIFRPFRGILGCFFVAVLDNLSYNQDSTLLSLSNLGLKSAHVFDPSRYMGMILLN